MTSCMYCKAPAKANHVCVECEEMATRLSENIDRELAEEKRQKELKESK